MGRKSKWLISILFALLGICGIAQAQDPHYVPFYRLYSDANKDHFYTTNKQDRDNAINSLGYQDEGIEGYISSCAFTGGTPLYHYWINDLKDNFYTANTTEKANLDQNPANNVYLGICAYINTSLFTNGFPLYRYYKQWPNGLGDHFYVNENQRAQAEAEGYTYENIITGYLSNFPSVPSTPTDLNATAVSSSQINLQWQDNADNETAFRIYRKIEGGAYNLQATIFDPDAESYSDTGLIANTKYYYKIAAYNSGGESTYSNEVYATTQSNLPNPPSNLSTTAVSSSQINLSWQDNSNNEDGFRIYRKTEGGVYDILVTITDPNTTAYSNTGLTVSTTYYYKVVSYNAAGNSDYSNEASATTQEDNIPSGWNIQTIDSAGEIGHYSSIAIDSNNNPHVSYPGNSGLKYAKWTGANWDIQTIEPTNCSDTSMALDSDNHPHIVYNAGDLKYAKWNGSSWSIQIIDYKIDWGVSIVLDSSDYPHISYQDEINRDLKYAKWTGSTWAIETIDSENKVGAYTSIKLDSNNYPRISYFDLTNYNLKYASWNGSSWSLQTVDSLGDVGTWTSLALDSNGNPQVSYSDDTNRDLKYAKWDSGTITYFIKGYVKDSGGSGISGVSINLSGTSSKSTNTLSSGYYEFSGLTQGNYTVTPSKTDWSFNPPNKTYNPLNTNQTNQNFIGTQSSNPAHYPDIRVSPTSFTKTLTQGTYSIETMTIYNDGNADLIITNIDQESGPPTWIGTFVPSTGTVSAGDQMNFTFHVDAVNLPVSSYLGKVKIHSNDPDTPIKEISVNLTVSEQSVPPSKPIPISPINGEIVTTKRPTFDWQEVAGQTDFRVVVTKNYSNPLDDPDPVVNYSASLPASQWTCNKDLADGEYYWIVNVANTSGTSPYSDIQSFKVSVVEQPVNPTPPDTTKSVGEGAPTESIKQAFIQAYANNGGLSGVGAPKSDNTGLVHQWGNGYVQNFTGGNHGDAVLIIKEGSNTAYCVWGGIWAKYASLQGPNSPLGFPTIEEYDDRGNIRCDFENGVIIYADNKTYAYYAAINSPAKNSNQGGKIEIKWQLSDDLASESSTIRIDYSKNNGDAWKTIASGELIDISSGQYVWDTRLIRYEETAIEETEGDPCHDPIVVGDGEYKIRIVVGVLDKHIAFTSILPNFNINNSLNGRKPVILIHGVASSANVWDIQNKSFKKALEDIREYVVWRFQYPTSATSQEQPIVRSAGLLSEALQSLKNANIGGINGDTKFSIIAHSMGGLVTRAYTVGLQENADTISTSDFELIHHSTITYNGDISKLIMLGTPNHGSDLQKVGNLFPGIIFNPDLSSAGKFINKLNEYGVNKDIQQAVIYGISPLLMNDGVVSTESAKLDEFNVQNFAVARIHSDFVRTYIRFIPKDYLTFTEINFNNIDSDTLLTLVKYLLKKDIDWTPKGNDNSIQIAVSDISKVNVFSAPDGTFINNTSVLQPAYKLTINTPNSEHIQAAVIDSIEIASESGELHGIPVFLR